MSSNVHPNPGPIFPCSVCTGNVTWRGRSVQCCICSKRVHLRCSQLSLSKFRALGSSHSWSCSPCRNTVTPSSDSSNMYTSTVQSGPPLLMLHSCPILVSKPLMPPSAHSVSPSSAPHLRPLLQAAFLRLLPPLLPLTPSGFFNGMLEVFEPEALNYFTFYDPILSTSSASRNPILTHLPLSRFLDSLLRSDHTHSRSGILSPDATHASSGVVTFVRQGLSFSELSTSSLSLLHPYSDYVGVNISLSNSFSVSFLNVYAPLFAPPQQMAEPIPFLPQFFPPPEISSFWGDFNCHHPIWDLRGTSDPCREEVFDWVISSDLLPLNDPDTSTLLHRSSGSRFSPESPFLPLLLLFLAPGRCFRTWVLTIYQFFYPSLSLRSFAPASVPLPSIFRKLSGMALPHTLTLTVPAKEYSSLFLSSAAALFTSLALNATKSSIPFGCIKRPPKSSWSAEVEEAVSERRKAFAATHRRDEDHQAYISASRRTSSVIAKTKAEAWQTTCSSFLPNSNP